MKPSSFFLILNFFLYTLPTLAEEPTLPFFSGEEILKQREQSVQEKEKHLEDIKRKIEEEKRKNTQGQIDLEEKTRQNLTLTQKGPVSNIIEAVFDFQKKILLLLFQGITSTFPYLVELSLKVIPLLKSFLPLG